MQIDPEEFRRHYDSLSDDALLEINRDELVDVAQQCYDEELARRGFEFEDETAEASPEPVAPEDWVIVATYTSGDEANLAYSMLESGQIPVRFESTKSSSFATGELRLMVPAEYLGEAETILGSPISDEELAAQAEAELPPDPDEEQ